MRRPSRVEYVGGVEIGPPGADDRADRRAAEDQSADSHVPACPPGPSRWAASLAVRRIYDKKNETLIYIVYSRQVKDASAKMSISTVALFKADVTWTKAKK